MAFIYSLTDSWNDVTTTWNGIKLAVTNTASDSSSKLLNLTVSGATTASFVVDKSGNLELNGSVNKVTITAPATAATFTLANNSTFATVGAHSATFTFTGTTAVTFPTSGTVTALGNSTTGSGGIVLATSPTLVTPNLGTPSAVTLTNGTGLPVSTGISGFGTGVAAALAANVGNSGAFVTFGGALGTPSSGDLSNCTGIPASGISGTVAIANGGTGQTTANAAFNALAPSQTGNNGKYLTTDGTNTSWATNPLGTVTSVDVSGGTTGLSFSGGPITTSGTITMAGTLAAANGGTGLTSLGSGVATWLGTPSSANLRAAVTDETGTGSLVFSNSPTFDDDITLGVSSTTQGELIFANTTANTVKLRSSNSTAANYTLTLPAAAPVNGYYLQTDTNGVLSWASGGGGGGGSPGGSNTQIQFNNAGAFGGDAAFTFVNGGATATMSLGVASTTSGVAKLYNSSSANALTIASGNNSAAWTLTLPTSAGTNGYLLQTDGSGNTSWVTPPATGLTVGSTSIASGTSGRILYDNAGTLGEKTVTGSGDVVLATSPSLTTPTLGVAAATSINKVAITTPATGSTLTIADGKTLTASNTLTFTGTDSSSIAFGAGGTVLYNGGALGTPSSGTLTSCTGLPISTGVSGLGSNVATFLATPSSANLAAAVTDETGSGALVFGTSPTFTTSALFPAGSVSAPGIAASGDTDTGIYFPAANKVALATNGAAALTVDSSQNVSVTGTLAMGSSFLRNRLINGGMNVYQRGSVSATTSGAYTLDRWFVTPTGATVTVTRSTSTVPSNFTASLNVAGAASVTNVSVYQRIESLNCQDFTSGAIVTVSGWIRQSTGSAVTTATVALTTPTASDNYTSTSSAASTYTIPSIANATWVYFSNAFTLTTGCTNGLQVTIALGGGLTTGSLNLTGVQLEVGSVATPFERRQYTHEQLLCQRYLPSFVSSSTISFVTGSGIAAYAAQAFYVISHIVPARVDPTGLVVSAAGDFYNNVAGGTVGNAIALSNGGIYASRINLTQSGSTMTVGQTSSLYCANASGYLYFTGCEL